MCIYENTEENEDTIVNAWQSDWGCPSLHLSDAWGIVPITEAEDWIRISEGNLSASLAEVIYSGRSGLRIGNMQTLATNSREAMKPSMPYRKVSRASAQKACGRSILNTFDPISLATSIADDLIPAAQAVSTESWPVSVCLRFSVEYLRLRVLKTLESAPAMNFRKAEILQASELQQAVVQSWKHKCESQVTNCVNDDTSLTQN